ncbi:hypothetical protein OOT46_26015 [Aquabacterium sp. A7-Y]|uniref:hypothetical protein n=1 Tax=Aquabacterium sp. A7-Y TaxID=1349605 RepID=UPI00223E3D78|nr:hypothetical protein [Aquabacterium sp. A7-Y]MCW7541271.1 hypothetical protein [Aquabacterium sp. A7-Y]
MAIELASRLRRVRGRAAPRLKNLGLPGAAGALLLCLTLLGAAWQLPGLRGEQDRVRDQLAELERRPKPLLRVASAASPSLVAQLPAEADLPGLLSQVFAAAQLQGVSVGQSDYGYAAGERGGPPSLQLRLDSMTSYANARRFVNQVVLTVPSAALTGFSIVRESEAQPVPRVRLSFAIYYRSVP